MSSRHQQSSITVLILFLFLLTIRINSSRETRGPVEDGIQTFFHVKDKPETGTKVVYEDQIIYPTENKFKQHSSRAIVFPTAKTEANDSVQQLQGLFTGEKPEEKNFNTIYSHPLNEHQHKYGHPKKHDLDLNRIPDTVMLMKSRNLQAKAEENNEEMQFEGLNPVESQPGSSASGRKKSKKALKRQKTRGGINPNNPNNNLNKKAKLLTKTVDKILVESDRYHLWWTGPLPETQSASVTENSHFFMPELWGKPHNSTANALFTVFYNEESDNGDNSNKKTERLSLQNYLHIFLGSLRRVFSGDIVLAMEQSLLGSANDQTIKSLLQKYRTTVYLLSEEFCSKDTNNQNIFSCGSYEERIPINIFRYYFYEKWLLNYSNTSLFLVSHPQLETLPIIFQENPFKPSFLSSWFPKYALSFSEEFFPNMIIKFSPVLKSLFQECYGDEISRTMTNAVAITSQAFMGTRDGLLIFANSMTRVSENTHRPVSF
jgi:hypothetical protein